MIHTTAAREETRSWDTQRQKLAGSQQSASDAEAIRAWIANPTAWPSADSYDLDTLVPCPTLARREAALRDRLPEWFWGNGPSARILSIGTGKAYFERKYWQQHEKIYVIDPSESTALGLTHFPLPNAEWLGTSLYDAPFHFDRPPQHAWLGASVHYLFGEFHGWHFMQRLAMMVSETLVIDAGVFDADSPQGKFLLENLWSGTDPCQLYRHESFSFAAFLEAIEPFWTVEAEWPTDWIDDGRRSLVLRRKLPARIERSELGPLEVVVERQDKWRDNWTISRTPGGYYKEIDGMSSLLAYDAFSKMAGWPDLVQAQVYNEDRYVGFVVKDLGDEMPDDPAVCEALLVQALVLALPLGLMPADLARGNIRMHEGRPVWIDIFFIHLREMDPFLALWTVTSLYKQYSTVPSRAHAANRLPGSVPIPADDESLLTLRVVGCPAAMTQGVAADVDVEVVNGTSTRVSSLQPFPLHISYHWVDAASRTRVVHDGERSIVGPPMAPGDSRRCKARVLPPDTPGEYLLQLRLVQEKVRWFEAQGPADCSVRVG